MIWKTMTICILALSGCGSSELPNCDAPEVIALATQIFQNNIYKSPIAEELIDIKKSSVAFTDIQIIKDGGTIKECSAKSAAQITLSPGGQRAIARSDVFSAAVLQGMRRQQPVQYIIRANEDRRLYVEIFAAPVPSSPDSVR